MGRLSSHGSLFNRISAITILTRNDVAGRGALAQPGVIRASFPWDLGYAPSAGCLPRAARLDTGARTDVESSVGRLSGDGVCRLVDALGNGQRAELSPARNLSGLRRMGDVARRKPEILLRVHEPPHYADDDPARTGQCVRPGARRSESADKLSARPSRACVHGH